MSGLLPYTFTVLRYVHDVVTGEFLNVSVLLSCPEADFIRERTRNTHGRLSAVFPDLDRDGFRTTVASLRRAVSTLRKELKAGGLFSRPADASTLSRQILPFDDSTLQWSPPGGGLTDDPEATLNRLYDRLVARYDETAPSRRSDEDVWRPVRDRLAERKIDARLQETVIRGQDDAIEFRHAWKNGRWHCIQPLSFDLASAENIKEKARKWTGHLAAVRDATEQFTPYFIVAKPQNEHLIDVYQSALSILKKGPIQPEIFTEDRTEELNRVHFGNRSYVGPQSGNTPAQRCLESEAPDYGFQTGRGLVSTIEREIQEHDANCEQYEQVNIEASEVHVTVKQS